MSLLSLMSLSGRLGLALTLASQAAALQGSLGPPVAPPENPMTLAKARLGRALFWDEQLSTLDTMACATCHLPEAGGADPRTMQDLPGSTYIGWDRTLGTEDDTHSSPGIAGHTSDLHLSFKKQTELGPQLTIRNTPMVFDAAYAPILLLDGKATADFIDPMTGQVISPVGAALESQAIIPYSDQKEMSFFERPVPDVIADVRASAPLALAENVPADLAAWIAGRSYDELFEEAFGSPGLDIVRIGQAVATYERTLVTHDQIPFDAYLDGDVNALTAEERAGYDVFLARGCVTCHPGAIMSDHEFRNIGLDGPYDDVGREFITGMATDHGRFRTPTLRNLALTAPYFHDGSALTIEDAVEFFDVGGRHAAPNKDPLIVPLGMSALEKSRLVAFLGRPLTDPRAANFEGPYERLGLYSESARRPQIYGAGTAGSQGETPRMWAIEPTRLGRTINVGVSRATPGAPAALLVSPEADVLGSPFQGATLHVRLGPGASSYRIQVASPGFGEGSQSLRLMLPDTPALAGTSLFAQWLIFDPHPGGRLAASPAVRMLLIH
ncbi:Cytochrome c551 peroxidase precursor [Planctomycetes bacterium Poly30]|uniref:Cytochrome c551 peroxidase n=2 Tax=Saltatorellus ferox TaxID=2528018 RepID=A0A518EMT1_9BACT|nr:Cytochrome c551 peroxidase precursor [Planctomycetes bacterium Poly30]